MNKHKRYYTKQSFKIMEMTRLTILTATSPVWIPLYLITVLSRYIEDLLMFLEDLLQSILDKIIPQVRE
ncbi:hypothetical protein RVS70_05250 [Virgibacillus sp. M23]|uniref:hypothetical protein n=1 Tax=Virgibacillus sp. M23 TaxID=3079030 RepID=UPI002A9190C6|nr:hypothetical protein [Virgibacillus sp. M23]MDY7043607.1 hypothetical protein [Virgibacillus sp. M23]